MNFPKNIFQTWKTNIIPEQWKNAQQSIIDKNIKWNYTLLTDDDNDKIIKNNFPDFYETFISFPYPIQRADAIRYCVLYLYGGIYLDLDYICNKPFDDMVLNNEIGLIKSNNISEVFTNSFLISQPKSQFWLYTIDQMKKKLPWYLNFTKHLTIMNSTGPLMIDSMAKKHNAFIQEFDNISVKCNVCNIKSCKINNTFYITPITGSSWHSLDSKIINIIYCNKLLLFLIIIIIIIIKKYL